MCLSHVAFEIGLFEGPFSLLLLTSSMSFILPEAVLGYVLKRLMYIWQSIGSADLPLGMGRFREIDVQASVFLHGGWPAAIFLVGLISHIIC